ERVPPDRVRAGRERADAGRDLQPAHPGGERVVPPLRVEDEDGRELDDLVEPKRHDLRPALQLRAEAGRDALQRRVRGRRRRNGERERDAEDDEALHRCGSPASGERCPNTGATSRSQKSITASTTTASANPERSTTDRGRRTDTSCTAAVAIKVQPI